MFTGALKILSQADGHCAAAREWKINKEIMLPHSVRNEGGAHIKCLTAAIVREKELDAVAESRTMLIDQYQVLL